MLIALAVDDTAYLHRNSIFLYLSWFDPTAYEKVQQATTKMLNGTCEFSVHACGAAQHNGAPHTTTLLLSDASLLLLRHASLDLHCILLHVIRG